MKSKYRWFVVLMFFFFMLLHQADRLLIGPLTTPIMDEFGINEAQMGLVSSFAILVAAIMYPVWGYLYDRYARAKLIALASFIWGSTTWLNAIAPNYTTFLITRSSTGIDDSSYPGIYSLLADYFGPNIRGKVYGLLQTAMPLGYMLGMILAMILRDTLGWRKVFILTGSLGILLAIVLFAGLKEPPRGKAEPELVDLAEIPSFRFDRKVALSLFRRKSLLFLFAQGFFGVFPWQVITFWFFRFLETERGFSAGETTSVMMVAILALSAGYFVGGSIGDFFFKRDYRGRALTSATGVLLGAILLTITLSIPSGQLVPFMIFMCLTGLTMSIAAPNVQATIHDVAEPEVRSTAQATLSFIENIGSAIAPALAGCIAVRSTLGNAILTICVSTWLLCAFLFLGVARYIRQDAERLRRVMQARAEATAAASE
ncbi:MAG: MFS transporter [Anaerolineae bacterium]|nr:MFS transporter [Anaerolineae bacterium]